jgi:hypothetical protein
LALPTSGIRLAFQVVLGVAGLGTIQSPLRPATRGNPLFSSSSSSLVLC